MSELVVYETKPKNAAELARLADLPLSEVRSLVQLEQVAARSAPLVIAVQVELTQLVTAMETIHRVKERTKATVIAMPDVAVEPWVQFLYEAGTDLVFRSMLDRAKVATLIRNRVRIRGERCGNEVDLSVTRQVWSRLPWKRHASGGSR